MGGAGDEFLGEGLEDGHFGGVSGVPVHVIEGMWQLYVLRHAIVCVWDMAFDKKDIKGRFLPLYQRK